MHKGQVIIGNWKVGNDLFNF